MDDWQYNHREEIIKLEKQGFQIVEDLVPLYDMIWYFKQTANLSKQAKLRLKWFDYYRKCENVSLTCRYFGISRKTFYKWKRRYNPFYLKSLEDQDRTPIRRRKPEITFLQEQRIITLRKKYLRYSKLKLAILF